MYLFYREGVITMENTKEDYPLILKASHLAEILDITAPTAYKLMKQETFPTIVIGRCKRVLRDEFFKWLEGQSL